MSSKNLRYMVLLLSSLILTTPLISVHFSNGDAEYIACLTLKASGGGLHPDYGLYIAGYLREIGIEVIVRVEDWPVYIGAPCCTFDYDLAIIDIEFPYGEFNPFSLFHSESGNDYYTGSNTIPYGAESDFLLEQALQTYDIENRTEIIYDWQNLAMDKIVPFLPLFSSNDYIATWGNLKDFNSTWSLTDNLPYIYFNSLHQGQENMNELILADSNWRTLNPLSITVHSSDFVSSLVNEPLIKLSPEGIPLRNGLIEDWESINESHYIFHLRDNVFWNPSYNVTERDVNSDPLDPLTASLMEGLKDNQTSDGTNRQITAIDAVFTLLSFGNEIVSEQANNYYWMKDIFLDPMDNLSFHLIIDGNKTSTELDSYYPLFNNLNIPVLPEFFLNSTSTVITNTTGNIPMVGLYEKIVETPEWTNYSLSPFGCGKYSIDHYIKNSFTKLQSSPYWLGIGGIDGTSQSLNIESIVIRVIPDISAATHEFLEGNLDIITESNVGLIDTLSDDPYFNIYQTVSNKITVLFFNLRRPFVGGAENFIFLDAEGKENYTKGVAVRKAMCYAIDREEINQELHRGNLTVTDYPIPEIHSNYRNPDIIKYSYDLDKAFEWLVPDNTPKPPIPDLLETLLILGGGFILIGAIPAYFLTKGLLEYRKLKRKPSEGSTNNIGSAKDM
ncbi:MAG: ABC transporter substrate-binding protein [Candidatus Heimdallarchaeaceae archaeon]